MLIHELGLAVKNYFLSLSARRNVATKKPSKVAEPFLLGRGTRKTLEQELEMVRVNDGEIMHRDRPLL